MRLVFVHGRSQGGKNPVELQQQWEDTLDEGLNAAGLTRPSGLTVEFPFYGDRIEELVGQVETGLVEKVAAKGSGPDSAQVDFRGAWFAEMYSRWRGRITALIEQGQESGEFNIPDPTNAAALLMAVMDGITVQLILGVGLKVDEELLASLDRAIFNALRGGDAPSKPSDKR